MEEDIKRIEELVQGAKKHYMYNEYFESMENLIKRNKELEEENKELKMITQLYNSFEVPDEKSRILIADTKYFVNGYFKKNFIKTEKIREIIKEIKVKIKSNENELKNNPDPVGSGFYSFDKYFEWKRKTLKENELLNHRIQVLQELLEEGGTNQ